MRRLRKAVAWILCVCLVVLYIPTSASVCVAASASGDIPPAGPATETDADMDTAQDMDAEKAEAETEEGTETTELPEEIILEEEGDAVTVLPEALMIPDAEGLTAERLPLDDLITNGGLLQPSAQTAADTYNHVHDAALIQALDNVEDILYVEGWGITRSNLRDVVFGLVNLSPQIFYLDSVVYLTDSENNVIYLNFEYSYDKSTIASMKKKFNTAVNTALNSVDTTGMTDVEIALAYHEYLTNTVAYNTEGYLNDTLGPNDFSAYGAFVDGEAVCQSYALAYMYLLTKKGITCGMATSDNANHAWNVVKLNGKWYHIDVTWDDPAWDTLGTSYHNFFLISEASLLKKASNRSDYRTATPYKYPYAKASDKSYENEFWTDATGYIYYFEGAWHYIADAAGGFSIVRMDYRNKQSSVLLTEEAAWPVWDRPGAVWEDQYGRLAAKANMLYFSTPTMIECLDLFSGERTVLYEPSTKQGYIYGIAKRGNRLAYVLHQSWDFEGKENLQYVTIPPILVTGITLSKKKVDIYRSSTYTLKATVSTKYADNQAVGWSSSDKNVATVNEKGVVTAVNEGHAVITVTAKDGSGVKAVCDVNVSLRELDDTDITLSSVLFTYNGERRTPTVTVTDNGKKLKRLTDYTVSFKNCTEIGTATVTVTGIGDYKGSRTFEYTIKPDKPVISSISNGTAGVKLAWSQVQGAGGYYVYRKQDGDTSYTKIKAISSGTSTSYVDKTAKSGKTYSYKIMAYKGANSGSASAEKSITFVGVTTVNDVTNHVKGVRVTWDRVSSASKYTVYRKAEGESNYKMIAAITPGSTVSYVDKTAVSGVTYSYRVYAHKNSCRGGASPEVTKMYLASPTILSVENKASHKMVLKWNKASEAEGYEIQYSVNSDMSGAKTVNVNGSSTTSKAVTGLTEGQTYYVRMRIYKNEAGTKQYSAWSGQETIKVTR